MEYLKNPFFKYYLLIFFVVALNQQNISQTNFSEILPSGLSRSSIINVGDTIVIEPKVEKNYWLPAVEVVGLNFGVWAYSEYLTSEGWANISWETIKNNFENGFEWDADGYLMNQFWHPYHGSNYYNLARSNGLGFWESAPYTVGGSLMWEYFMETEPPSYGDIVNTSVTGIILGEISFRVSNLIIDESTTGFERVARELSSTLVNPMQGFNRLIKGDMWKSGTSNRKDNFDAEVSLGAHNVFIDSKIEKSTTYLMLKLNMNYGNQFYVDANKKPFDYFTLHTEINLTPDDNIVGIFASGVLWDAHLDFFNNSKNIIGIYKEVDILINTVYKLSATSATGQIINTVPLSSKVSMQNFLGLSAILMGATNSQYSSEYGKDYNIGPGASAKAGIAFLIKDLGDIHLNYKRYWIHTLSGAESEQFVGLLKAGISYNLSTDLDIGFDILLYERYGDYKYFPNTQSSNTAIRLFLSHNI